MTAANPQKILVIQTAFIGDAILATAVLESLHEAFPKVKIDYLIRKGAEGLFEDHPFINSVIVFDKKASRLREIYRLLKRIRAARYSHVINCHRFGSSGLLTLFSGADYTTGFKAHPFSFSFSHKATHVIDGNGSPHEIERNHGLIAELVRSKPSMPKLYPPDQPFITDSFICVAPASVWATKQYPIDNWVQLIDSVPAGITVFLMGGPGDRELCDGILKGASHPNVINKSGELSLLESAGWMAKADMNYTNDSAPCHLATAVNAPVTVAFVSTVPEFGFTPLSDNAIIRQVEVQLACRPCGLHGHSRCPEGHFNCAKFDLKYGDS